MTIQQTVFSYLHFSIRLVKICNFQLSTVLKIRRIMKPVCKFACIFGIFRLTRLGMCTVKCFLFAGCLGTACYQTDAAHQQEHPEADLSQNWQGMVSIVVTSAHCFMVWHRIVNSFLMTVMPRKVLNMLCYFLCLLNKCTTGYKQILHLPTGIFLGILWKYQYLPKHWG